MRYKTTISLCLVFALGSACAAPKEYASYRQLLNAANQNRQYDGAIIFMSYTGVVGQGPSGLYWRVRPIFSTTSEKYDWLNHTVFIGKNKQIPGKVAYDVFRIL